MKNFKGGGGLSDVLAFEEHAQDFLACLASNEDKAAFASLTDPYDPRHPFDFGGLEGAWRVIRVGGVEFDGFRRAPAQDFGHDFAIDRPHDHAIASAHGRGGRHHEDIAVAVERQHRIARYLQCISHIVPFTGKLHFVPSCADRKTGVVKKAAGPRLR